MRNFKIYWNLFVNTDTKETIKGFDVFSIDEEIIDDEQYFEDLLESLLFSDYDSNIEFSIQVDTYHSRIENFKITSIVELLKENKKTYNLFLKTPFFYKISLEETLKEEFKLQFPKLGKIEMLDDFDLISVSFTSGFIIKFTSCENIEKLYKKEFDLTIDIINKMNNVDVKIEKNIQKDFSVKTIDNLKNINGTIAILEGDDSFTEIQKNLFKFFDKNNINYTTISSLYRKPEKLKEILGIDNLIIQTTGFNIDGLTKLMDSFVKLNYIPKRVFFLLETLNVKEEISKHIERYKVNSENFDVKIIK